MRCAYPPYGIDKDLMTMLANDSTEKANLHEAIDIGANLTGSEFSRDLEAVLRQAAEAGVGTILVTGTSVSASMQALALAEQWPEQLYGTAGIHPHHAKDFAPGDVRTLLELLQSDRVVAVGETGLDFFRNFSSPEDQVRCLEAHLEIAIDTGKPLFLHDRDAFPRLHEMVKSVRDDISNGVVHCFTGTREALYAYLDLDLYIGITGWICDERRGQDLQKLVRDIPSDRLLIETDSPYLLPRTLRPKPRSRRNVPANLIAVAESVALHRQQPLETVLANTTRNARECFNLPAPNR